MLIKVIRFYLEELKNATKYRRGYRNLVKKKT